MTKRKENMGRRRGKGGGGGGGAALVLKIARKNKNVGLFWTWLNAMTERGDLVTHSRRAFVRPITIYDNYCISFCIVFRYHSSSLNFWIVFKFVLFLDFSSVPGIHILTKSEMRHTICSFFITHIICSIVSLHDTAHKSLSCFSFKIFVAYILFVQIWYNLASNRFTHKRNSFIKSF